MLGQDCVLCGANDRGRVVCRACECSLPRIGTACHRCAMPIAVPGTCGACLRRPPPFDAAVAAFPYAFPVDRMVLRYKAGADFALGRWLAEALAARVVACERPDVLVATPLTRRRLRERGFNQALQLARIVGTALGVPVDATAVVKRGETAPQAGLAREARRVNLRGAFEGTRALGGLRVAVVDDVMTTGATAGAMAAALEACGAAKVVVWAVARAA